MITKSQIENTIISELEALEGVVAKRDMGQNTLTPAVNTVFVKVKSYKFANEDENEDYGIYKHQKVFIDIQIRIVYRTAKESSNISEFEDKVICKLVALELINEEEGIQGLVLRPAQLNETQDVEKDVKQSLNIFRIITFMDFSVPEE